MAAFQAEVQSVRRPDRLPQDQNDDGRSERPPQQNQDYQTKQRLPQIRPR